MHPVYSRRARQLLLALTSCSGVIVGAMNLLALSRWPTPVLLIDLWWGVTACIAFALSGLREWGESSSP